MNKPIIRKRGRPKKINKDNQNNIKPIEHELILYYPFKLCDFENNLDNHQVVDNIFNNNDFSNINNAIICKSWSKTCKNIKRKGI